MIGFEWDFGESADMGGLMKPVAMCDRCGKPILKEGNVLWINPDIRPKTGKFAFVPRAMFHTHKRCNRAFEAEYKRRNGPTHFFSEDIADHLAQLLNNTVATRDSDARKLVALVDKIKAVTP